MNTATNNNTGVARKVAKIVIERNSFYTSPATGRTYWVDDKGLATEFNEDECADGVAFGCECEQDWNCGLHGGTTRPTWIETRYDGKDW